jgi:hypothetical protein
MISDKIDYKIHNMNSVTMVVSIFLITKLHYLHKYNSDIETEE